MASTSKKIQKVIDGIRAWNLSSSSNNPRSEVEEVLKSDNFKFGKIVQYGFPNEPTCIAYEPVQRLLIVGTKQGSGRILGRPGVDHCFQQPSGSAIIQIIFLVNQGIFLTVCADETIHQWSYQSKPAELVQSLQFKRESLTCGYMSPGGCWLYVGTERGNVFFVNVQKFCISGYVVNWNKAIDLSQSNHPGSIVQLGECPTESNKLLIGFSTGFLSLWSLKEKSAKFRFKFNETLHGYCWFPDGKNFITCHNGGYLVTWNSRQSNTPLSVIQPHNRDNLMDVKTTSFEPIKKVMLLSTKSNDSIMVFSGGTPINSTSDSGEKSAASSLPSITVMKDKRLTILQMDYPVVDFTQLVDCPYIDTFTDPFGLVILLENDLMVIDLLSPNYPSFENPYPIDLHVSPVTCLNYLNDCPGEFVAALYTAKPRTAASTKQKAPPPPLAPPHPTSSTSTTTSQSADNQTSSSSSAAASNTTNQSNPYSSSEWPINGGQWGSLLTSNSELIITGHADGSMRFWDATGTYLTSLYKFRLTTFFEKPSQTHHQHHHRQRQPVHVDDCGKPCQHEHNILNSNVIQPNNNDTDPLAIKMIKLCPDSKKIMVAGKYYSTLLSFTRREVICDVPVLDTLIEYELHEEAEVATEDYGIGSRDSASSSSTNPQKQTSVTSTSLLQQQQSLYGSVHQPASGGVEEKESHLFIGVKSGLIKWAPGYQPDVVCRLASPTCTPPPDICSIAFNSNYGLMAFGNEQGIVIVDFVQKICLMSSGTPDLYGSNDPFNRALWIPSNRRDENKSSLSDTQTNTFDGCSNPSCASTANTGSVSSTGTATNDQCFEPNKSSTSTKSAHIYKSELKRGKSNVPLLEKFIKLLIKPFAESGHFSRSTSSSTSSLENITSETITYLSFGDTYSRKSESNPKPCLWVGTSLGSCIAVNINLPDLRTTQPVIVSPSGTIFRLKGAIVCIGFLDNSGDILSSTLTSSTSTVGMATSAGLTRPGSESRIVSSYSYHESSGGPGYAVNSNAINNAITPTSNKKAMSMMSKQATVPNSNSSHGFASQNPPINSDGTASSNEFAQSNSDLHYVVICSEKSAEVVSMPHQTSISRSKITETSAVVSANIISLHTGNTNTTSTSSSVSASASTIANSAGSGRPSSSGTCLVVLLANRHLMVFSLPGLRFLMDIDSPIPPPLTSVAVSSSLIGTNCNHDNPTSSASTSNSTNQCTSVCVASDGLIIFMSSHSQLEKVTVSADLLSNIKNIQGDLYLPKELQNAPKKSFFETLFNAGAQQLDRDELFGETKSGKASSTTATLVNNKMDRAHMSSANAQSEIAKARLAAIERGEKLSEAELKTQEMMDQAKTFSSTASALAAKYEKKDKRWGMPF